ncbi:hypothetical protein [Massilia sp. TS11]|uniref:hypothetical protein n=1 Tax=Massilia sp. TS11 TaxID=2908003 RepID=UPI001EDBEB42|nr:hypothetical protein [Massilia sp. TS11]MCG2583216.1 hypothetical protein [Massilia sp. TS11]
MRRRAVLLAALALSACVPARNKLAEEAVARFHAMLNDERFAEIYEAASKELRAKTARPVFISYLADVRRRYGLSLKATVDKVDAFRADGFDYLTVECTTEFANGNVAEHFALKRVGEDVLLAGYAVRFQRET